MADAQINIGQMSFGSAKLQKSFADDEHIFVARGGSGHRIGGVMDRSLAEGRFQAKMVFTERIFVSPLSRFHAMFLIEG